MPRGRERRRRADTDCRDPIRVEFDKAPAKIPYLIKLSCLAALKQHVFPVQDPHHGVMPDPVDGRGLALTAHYDDVRLDSSGR